ncbi:MAG TPA: hypothetical protein VJY34_10050, partial [Roseiarcus sp.]|nr:hypothetical protein [Roseiarcus sp.]
RSRISGGRIIHTLTHVSPPHVPKNRAPPGIFTKTVANETHPSLGVTEKHDFLPNHLESLIFLGGSGPKAGENSPYFRMNRERGGQTGVGRGLDPCAGSGALSVSDRFRSRNG